MRTDEFLGCSGFQDLWQLGLVPSDATCVPSLRCHLLQEVPSIRIDDPCDTSTAPRPALIECDCPCLTLGQPREQESCLS